MIYLDIIILSITIVVLSFIIIQVRKMKSVEYSKVLLSAKYGVQGIQTIDVTAILESIGSNTIVHNYHFDPKDKLLPGTKKHLYLTYALATKEILAEGDNVGEFDIVEWVEEAKQMEPSDTQLTKIDVSDNVYLQYDEEDTWISIADKENWYYDEIGAVVISVEDAKLLLPKLKELIEIIESKEAE